MLLLLLLLLSVSPHIRRLRVYMYMCICMVVCIRTDSAMVGVCGERERKKPLKRTRTHAGEEGHGEGDFCPPGTKDK